mmetsp:Transcript_14481/g.51492  ORF Transcript_14481/g.51492 Transcript_14481/m.51492 type:complete len:219 (+) Transcript_14481:986-1642(+)
MLHRPRRKPHARRRLRRPARRAVQGAHWVSVARGPQLRAPPHRRRRGRGRVRRRAPRRHGGAHRLPRRGIVGGRGVAAAHLCLRRARVVAGLYSKGLCVRSGQFGPGREAARRGQLPRRRSRRRRAGRALRPPQALVGRRAPRAARIGRRAVRGVCDRPRQVHAVRLARGGGVDGARVDRRRCRLRRVCIHRAPARQLATTRRRRKGTRLTSRLCTAP